MDTKGIVIVIKLAAFIAILSIFSIIGRLLGWNNKGSEDTTSQNNTPSPTVTVVPTSITVITSSSDLPLVAKEIDTLIADVNTLQTEMEALEVLFSTVEVDKKIVELNAVPTTSPSASENITNLANAKERAIQICDSFFLEKLNSLRAQTSVNVKLGAEVKAEILKKIDDEIIWFTNKKDILSLVTTVATAKSIVKEERVRFSTSGSELKRAYITLVFAKVLDSVAEKLDKKAISLIDTKLKDMSENGIDVKAEITLLSTAKNELTLAQSDLEKLQTNTTFAIVKKNIESAKAKVLSVEKNLKVILENLKTKISE